MNINKDKNKVREVNNKFEYDESVNEFCGLIFHCPNCNEEFHIHVANVWLNNKKGKRNLEN